jgi:hypothetical protein
MEEKFMRLQSKLFRGDLKLEATAISHPAHIVPGASGDHVGKIQQALLLLGDVGIGPAEQQAKCYGPSTADAVLAFKRKRRIINYSYQTEADNIVGKMTMAALDREMVDKESVPSDLVRFEPSLLWRPYRYWRR